MWIYFGNVKLINMIHRLDFFKYNNELNPVCCILQKLETFYQQSLEDGEQAVNTAWDMI